jgi:transcriptional regulator with XRE-family HTH domain
MNFNKIKNLAEKKKITIVSIGETTGITPTGIHKFVKNHDCKVSDLEKISEALGVSPGYWWKDENENMMVSEPESQYGFKSENEYLRKQIEEKERYINRLEKDLERYETGES